MNLLVIAGVALVFLLAWRPKPRDLPINPAGQVIPPDNATWNYTDRWPPPGQPADVGRPGARGGAAAAVRAEAERISGGKPGFVAACLTLAWHESGASYNLPAFKYDNRIKADRPIDPKTGEPKGRISAWGLFQWQDEWAKTHTGWTRAYQMTRDDQVKVCVKVYWNKCIPFGGDPRAVFIAHVSPTALKHQRQAGGKIDLDKLPAGVRKSVDKYIKEWNERLKGAPEV